MKYRCPLCPKQFNNWYHRMAHCRMRHPQTIPEVEEKKMKRFYVAAKHIASAIQMGRDAECMHENVEQAVTDAKLRIQRGEIDSAVVVQIVKIVRKEFPPIVVEDVSND